MKTRTHLKKLELTSSEKNHLGFHVFVYCQYSLQQVHRAAYKPPLSRIKKKPKPPSQKEVITKEPIEVPRRRFIARLYGRPRIVKTSLVVSALLLLIIGVQLLYPHSRTLPFSRLESHGYLGFADSNTVLDSFEDFDSRIITVHTHTKNLTTSYKDLGVTIKPDETVRSMTDYSTAERLIPFSILVKGNKRYPISRDLDESQLSLFVKDVIAQASRLPKDAEVRLSGTQILITPSEEGYEYQTSALRSQILRADLSDRAQIVFAPTILQPDISTENAKIITSRMQQRIDSPITINGEAIVMSIDSGTLASWLDITHKPSEKTIEMSFNKNRIADSLRSFPGQVDKSPVRTIVTYLNGVQVGRTEGSVGKVLQLNNLVEKVAATTSPATSTVEASVTTVLPTEVIDRKYTKDSLGFQNLLEYWTSVHKGQYSIDLRSLSDRIEANINPHRLFPSVGIYRLYVASTVYGRISANSLSPSTITQTGQTVDVCLDRMIRESEEGCTNALGSLIGWGASDSMLQAQGFENTTLTEGASLTTAQDTSDWMIKLLTSNITTKSQADSLVKMMARQNVRSGLPGGSMGITVANKTGNFGRIKHDVGIVYHPSGTYVLSVLSEGSELSLIADLASEINKTMAQ